MVKGLFSALTIMLSCALAMACSEDSTTGLFGGTDPSAATDIDIDTDADTNADTSIDTYGDSGADTHRDSETTVAESCRLVDVVIAVDGSGSMTEERRALRDTVFPAFAERLRSISKGLDNFRVATLDACPDPANFHTRGKSGECNFVGGDVWIDSASPNLVDEFSCVGNIYLDDANCSGDNDDEQPASTVAAALEPPYISGPNAGFLRDDALLIVVAITDEDEQPTGLAQTPQEIYQRLIDIKGGDVERMVFLGVGATSRCEGPYGSAYPATKLKRLTDLFIDVERGVWWDLCAGQMEDGLEQAFEIIEQACEEFDPVV